MNNWEVFKAHINGDKKIFHNFERIGEIARAMHHALSMADWKQVAELIREEWKLRKTNSPRITTPMIEKLVAVAMRQGALAAKVCGAGGGGCASCSPSRRTATISRPPSAVMGGQVLPALVARDGLTVSGPTLGAE